jgi:hypothetical protein
MTRPSSCVEEPSELNRSSPCREDTKGLKILHGLMKVGSSLGDKGTQLR